ncbi:MAG: GGDEF domain-containing phosphodiesterase, partial [Campylobacterota bacterium]|nr:GGDEF domain-containing phosphodiesterase [Campylobacterota bacterium]
MTSKTESKTPSQLQQEIAELKKANKQLEAKVENFLYTNSSTGLKSRYALIENIGKSSIPTLFLIDINDYTRYMDIYGSETANELLKMFAQLLEAYNDDKGYTLYHIESDIFCMLHPSEYINTDKYESDIFELIETVLENPLYIPSIDDTLYIDITVGISSEASNLLNRAYDALSHAKKTKKRFVYYHPFHDQTQEHRNILHVKKEIQKTIEANNFVPVYQPIVNQKGEIIKYEVLLRMRQDDTLVSPEYFLDIAAKTNQYEQISQYTLIKAVEAFKERSELLSLNFTQADINNKELLRHIESLLKQYAMTERTIFEIVESDAIEDYESTRNFVEHFRSMGVRIAIDDFGSGYANFSHIMELEPEYLKIDGSLIKDIQKDKKSFIMVKSITQFAQDLGIKTIAEYVETKEIFEILLALGVDEYQGYYFGKP